MKKAHFIGICGVGMSATAVLLKREGWSVSGSDLGAYPPASDYLERHGIAFSTSYAAEHLPVDADLIVIGKNAKLKPGENPEVAAAMEHAAPKRSFAEVLGELAQDTHNVIVAGSYGKSTTSALIAWCLLSAGKDSGYFVGAYAHGFDETARRGSGSIFVFEGDEYPASNWDDRSKFLHYNACDVLLTSAVHDHVNVYPTLEDYHRPFKELLAGLPEDGLIVACADEPLALALATESGKQVVSYGLHGGTWRANNISYGETTTFSLEQDGKQVIELSTKLLGEHNIQNIVGAAALLLERELVTPEELRDGIASFEGVQRRLDQKTSNTSVLVYEGFGSSYMKAQAAIATMKKHYPDRRLIIVFEPYEFSWRNRAKASWYDDVFTPADMVFVYKPPTHGADTHEQLSHEEIVEHIKKSGTSVHPITSADDGIAELEQTLAPDDVVLLISSGTIGGLIEKIPKLVERRFSL